MRIRTLAVIALVVIAAGLVVLWGCESTTTSPFTGLPVSRDQLAAEKQVADAKARADALEAAAAEQARKDAATRAARTALGSIERTTTAKVENLNAEHASQVRDIRTTAEDAVARIQASVEDVAQTADFNIAKAGRDLEAENARLTGLFAGASADLDKKDARTALLTGGLVQVGNVGVPILAAAAGPAGGAVSSIWSILSGVILGGGVAGGAGVVATRLQKMKTVAEAERADEAEDAHDETIEKAERSFDAIEIAKDANPAFKKAFADVAPLIKEHAGEDATKFVHSLKEFGKAA